MLRILASTRLLIALAVLCMAGLAFQRIDPDRMQQLRERWASMSAEDRQRLRERWNHFQQMPPEERSAILDNARALEVMQQRIEATLTPEQQQRWNALSVERKREMMREMFHGIGSRMKDRLPPEIVERMRNANPQQRQQVYLEAKKSLVEGFVRERGLPAGVSAERWAEIQALEPKAFLDATREHFRSHASRGGPERRWDGPERGTERGPERGPVRDMDRGTDRPRGERGERGDRGEGKRPEFPRDGAGPRDEQEHQRMHSLRDAWHPRPGDFLDFADLEPRERAERVRERVRERLLQALLSEGQLSPEEAARLKSFPKEQFEQELRKRIPGGPERRNAPHRGPNER
jgi:hypothetical protein